MDSRHRLQARFLTPIVAFSGWRSVSSEAPEKSFRKRTHLFNRRLEWNNRRAAMAPPNAGDPGRSAFGRAVSFGVQQRPDPSSPTRYRSCWCNRGLEVHAANLRRATSTNHCARMMLSVCASLPMSTPIYVLRALSMISVEQTLSSQFEFGVSNAYRLVGVESRVHMGTRAGVLQA